MLHVTVSLLGAQPLPAFCRTSPHAPTLRDRRRQNHSDNHSDRRPHTPRDPSRLNHSAIHSLKSTAAPVLQPPELAGLSDEDANRNGADYDKTADLWALGVSVCESAVPRSVHFFLPFFSLATTSFGGAC